MTISDLNTKLSQLEEQPSREIILDFSFTLLEWMGITTNIGRKPQLLSPQTQKLKDYLATAPQTVQPQLYRISEEKQNIRVRFAVLKKLKKEYISQLVDNDTGLNSYQSFIKGLNQQAIEAGFIPTQPYSIHFVTTTDYNKLVLIFNQGEQKRIVTFRNRLTNTQYNKIIQQWHDIGKRSKPEIDDILWKSLDIKEVNKEFYKQIKEQFDALLSIVKTQYNNSTDNQLKQFAVRLIGRYIFCWFLKEKGIIPQTLISVKTIANTKNYYQNTLIKLFFEILNTKVQDRILFTAYESFEKIPYLNGGLFDKSNEDELFSPLNLDAWLLSFVSILESFDFTVDESSSQYQQVAVDPEMLGRIFENLLASQNEETKKLANQRKAFGAFYTPREIVDYMVNESIKSFLQTHWEQSIIQDQTRNINNPEPIGDIFGSKKPQQLVIETKLYELKTEDKTKIEKAIYPLFLYIPDASHLKKEEKSLLLNFLEQIKILDPACGSGAFPMGILHKLVELHEILGTVKSSYELKKDILSQNTYGVDIMPMAIEIARLRAWLSLVLEEEYKPSDTKHNFGIKPLPNLDFKFVCANSLIDLGLDNFIQESKGTLHEGFTENLVKDLKDLESLRTKFFQPSLASSEKNLLEKEYFVQLNEVVTKIEDAHEISLKQIAQKIKYWNPFDDSSASSFFSPTWMFGIDDGFDLVIANPPYVGQKNHKEMFQKIKDSELGRKYHQRRMDLFYFFFHHGLSVLKPSGILTFITTNYFLTATYSDKLRKHIHDDSTVLNLINFNELKIFESAQGQHNLITVLKKGKSPEVIAKTCMTQKHGLADETIIAEIINRKDEDTEYHEQSQRSLFEEGTLYIRIESERVTNSDTKNIFDVLNKMKVDSDLLSKYCEIEQGIVSGADKVSKSHLLEYPTYNFQKGKGIYVLTNQEVRELNFSAEDKSFLKKTYKNSEIRKWVISANNNLNVIYIKSNGDYFEPSNGIKKHLDAFKIILINRNVRVGSITEEDYHEFVIGKKEISYIMNASSMKKGNYYSLSYARRAKNTFEVPKIVNSRRSNSNTFALEDKGYYEQSDIVITTLKPKYSKTIDIKYFLGILNSKLLYSWFYHKGKRKGEQLEIFQKPLSEIPIKIGSTTTQQAIISLVDTIIEYKKQNPEADVSKDQKELDKIVYKLYALSYDEVKIIDKFFGLSQEEYENYEIDSIR